MRRFVSSFAGLLMLAVFTGAAGMERAAAAETTSFVVQEGNDFATLKVYDPWDMDDFYDISHGFDGDYFKITNFSVTDGVFEGRSTDGSPSIYLLHPGYLPGLLTGYIGYLYPIEPAQYACLSVASYLPAGPISYHWVSWIEDMGLSQGGFTYGMRLDPGKWKLYQYDLRTHPYQSGKHWLTQPWLGLRLHITNQPYTDFKVDWARLTDCTPVEVALSGLPANATLDIWIQRPYKHLILAAEGVIADPNGGYTWDVQGIEPGTYSYYVKQGSIEVQRGTLTIQASPLPTFTNPTPFSGDDYATLAGNPWDMQDQQDITGVDCATYSILNDILQVDTLSPSNPAMPARCIGVGAHEADPKIYLNTPVVEDITQYRYLSFRHKIDAPWHRPAEGMIVRWIWEMTGLAASACKYVSNEFTLDVGWHTYWVDLHNPWNGTPIEVGGVNAKDCPKNVTWATQPGTLYRFRLDPNENILGYTIQQQFDWIRLTKAPSVRKGTPFPIQVSLNKAPEGVEVTFYYTNNLSNPTQNLVIEWGAAQVTSGMPPASIDAEYQLFLPFIMLNPIRLEPPDPVENEVLVYWDTRTVTPGEYYLCAVSDDGYNQTTRCSEAVIEVLP